MSKGGTSIPESATELKRTIEVLAEGLPAIQALTRADVLQNLSLASEFAPAFANLGIAQEAQFGGTQRAQASEAQRQSAAGQIFNVAQLSPALRQAEQIANPGQEAIRGELTQQIGTELGQGSQLDPELQRQFQQQVRSAQTARGIAFGNAPISEEALFIGGRAQQLRQQRQQAAANLLQLNQSTQINPFGFVGGAQFGQAGIPQIPTQGSMGQLFPQQLARTQQLSSASASAANLGGGGIFGQGGSVGGAIGGATGLGGLGALAGASNPAIAGLATVGGLAGLF